MRILRHRYKPKPFKAIGIKPRNPRLARNNLQFYNDFGHGAVIPLVAQVIEVKIAAFTAATTRSRVSRAWIGR
jgi:hypothetical protein